jgi:cell division protein ZapA
VRLFGREYSIRGHGDKNYIQKVSDYIIERSETIQRQASAVSTLDLVILTLLNITDEMFQDKEAKERTIRELEEKTDRLLRTIDRTV